MLRNLSNPGNVNISFLLCSVLTLTPDNSFFKEVKIKQDLFWNPDNNSFIVASLNEERLSKLLSGLLNTLPLRQTAYDIAVPLLKQGFKPSNNQNINTYEVRILQKYLKKYQYIYRRYFLINYDNNLTNKELNYFAIESLLLLLGA